MAAVMAQKAVDHTMGGAVSFETQPRQRVCPPSPPRTVGLRMVRSVEGRCDNATTV